MRFGAHDLEVGTCVREVCRLSFLVYGSWVLLSKIKILQLRIAPGHKFDLPGTRPMVTAGAADAHDVGPKAAECHPVAIRSAAGAHSARLEFAELQPLVTGGAADAHDA